jgi:parallel beta-helix repeat protein/predicted outer membrane repeat protein
MKKTFVIIAAILSSFFFSYAQTIIPAGNVSGTWTSAGSPYLIQGAIMIPNNATLNIEPGVTVNFQGPYELYAQGRILAIGTAADTITFTAADTTAGWLGIQFDNTPITNDTSKFYYCKLQYSKATGNGGAFFILGFSKVVISNSHISNCRTDSYPGGGGIQCSGCSPVITRNTVTHNMTSYGGGGICCENASPVITHNLISNNVASNGGGGIECFGIYNASNAIITNNIISGNTASFGGGISSSNNSPVIINNRISNNTATNGGGISCSSDGTPTISSNTISNNTANESGGGIYCDYTYASPTFTNNTIVNNSAAKGGALSCSLYSSVNLYNAILWGNTASTSGPQVYLDDENSDPGFYYCDLQGGTAEFGLNGGIFYTGIFQDNSEAIPMFVSPTAGSGTGYEGLTGDWSLQEASPCINAGTPDTSGLILPVFDLAGNPRIKGGRIDIGAYEYLLPNSIHEMQNTISMDIYPNPVIGKLTIEIPNCSEIEILTVDGHLIKTIYNNARKTTLDLNDLSSGVYIIKAKSDNGNAIRKFVKE